jgi:hypothetical protein
LANAEARSGGVSADRDGLVQVESRRFDAIHVMPGADFRGYTKILLDPARVAFAESWMRDVNQGRDLSRRTTSEDAEQIAEEARTGFGAIFTDALKSAGYEVVAAPGADVLRLSPQVVDLSITAPEKLTTSPRTRVYAADAGQATFVLQVRDSTTGALLARATDRRTAGDRGNFRNQGNLRLRYPSSAVANRGDFGVLFASWARTSAQALAEFKSHSPVAPAAEAPKP